MVAEPLTLLQIFLNGLTMGGIYGLMGLGLSLVFGVMGIVNAGHGALYMLGAYIIFTAAYIIGLDAWTSLLFVIGLMFIIGIVIERFLIEPIRDSAASVIILTLGLAICFEQSIIIAYGGEYKPIPAHILGTLVGFNVIVLQSQRVLAFAIAIITVLLLWIFLNKTKVGKATRVASFDKEVALSFGINVTKISALAFGIATALVALAAALAGPLFAVYPSVGWEVLIIAFVVVILGGMGNVYGTMLAGIIYGIVESYVGFFVASEWKMISALIMIIIVLLIRPQGLMGKVVERV